MMKTYFTVCPKQTTVCITYYPTPKSSFRQSERTRSTFQSPRFK